MHCLFVGLFAAALVAPLPVAAGAWPRVPNAPAKTWLSASFTCPAGRLPTTVASACSATIQYPTNVSGLASGVLDPANGDLALYHDGCTHVVGFPCVEAPFTLASPNCAAGGACTYAITFRPPAQGGSTLRLALYRPARVVGYVTVTPETLVVEATVLSNGATGFGSGALTVVLAIVLAGAVL